MQALTGKFTTFVARIFGCWHAELSRPFSREGRAYRTCLNCGAQRKFNLGNWELQAGSITTFNHPSIHRDAETYGFAVVFLSE